MRKKQDTICRTIVTLPPTFRGRMPKYVIRRQKNNDGTYAVVTNSKDRDALLRWCSGVWIRYWNKEDNNV